MFSLMASIILARCSLAFSSTTVWNHALSGHVFRTLRDVEWINCIQACQADPQCLSYNFLHASSHRMRGLCELNDGGLTSLCDRETLLTYYAGSIFQQMSAEETQSCTQLTLPNRTTSESADFSLSFTRKSPEDFVVKRGMPKLSTLTVCFWVKTRQGRQRTRTPFSYAGPGEPSQLMIQINDGLVFVVGGEQRKIGISVNDGKWHHICVTWSSEDGDWSLFKDGGVVGSGSNFKQGHVIPNGGQLFLGQEQISGGTLNPSGSFFGKIANFNIWSYKVRATEVMRMSNSCSLESGNVFQWSSFKAGVTCKGRVKITQPSYCTV